MHDQHNNFVSFQFIGAVIWEKCGAEVFKNNLYQFPWAIRTNNQSRQLGFNYWEFLLSIEPRAAN